MLCDNWQSKLKIMLFFATVLISKVDILTIYFLQWTFRFAEEGSNVLQFGNSLVQLTNEGCAKSLIENPTGITQTLEMEVWLGHPSEAILIVPEKEELLDQEENSARIEMVKTEDVDKRKMKLSSITAEVQYYSMKR